MKETTSLQSLSRRDQSKIEGGVRRGAQKQEPSQSMKKEKRWNLPKHELVALARCFLPDILAFYETEEGQREYEEWMKTRNLS